MEDPLTVLVPGVGPPLALLGLVEQGHQLLLQHLHASTLLLRQGRCGAQKENVRWRGWNVRTSGRFGTSGGLERQNVRKVWNVRRV